VINGSGSALPGTPQAFCYCHAFYPALPFAQVEEPLVSIVVPTLNSARTVRRTMESLRSLDYHNFEVVVVDGLSEDETLRIVEEFQAYYHLRVVVEPRRGRGVAYNRGIQESRGKYVAFLDSDATVATPTWIKRVVEVMERDPQVGVVFTKVFAPPDSSFLQKSIDTFLCKGSTTANGAVYRREAVLKVGGFNQAMNYMQEDELLYRLRRSGYSSVVNQIDFVYHYHRASLVSYLRQNAEAAVGARTYYALTGERRSLVDSAVRLGLLWGSLAAVGALALFHLYAFIPLLAVLGYTGLLVKVQRETCRQYKLSKYLLGAPLLIYLSLLGFSLGLVRRDGE
jgi:glycosyltransferase involved in cell wall biosynthesis